MKNVGCTQHDFKVDGKYIFEIGGRNKDLLSARPLTLGHKQTSLHGSRSIADFSQIAGLKDSYVFADDWDMPDGAKLPLWMLGFLY